MNPAEMLRRRVSGRELELLERLGGMAESRGERLFLVGGAVRDLMLIGRGPDMDLVLEGDAVQFAKHAASELGFGFVRHQAFGTAALSVDEKLHIDIATARRETYSYPGALPEVKPDTIESDLRRRDFTINAMALSLLPPSFGDVIDPFNGAADLSRKIIRALHDRSFIDDPTRILRGMRLSGRLEFNFDELTENLIRAALSRRAFDSVSGTRIKKEIKLIFDEAERGRIISRCRTIGIGSAIQPGVEFGADLLSPEDLVRKAWTALSGSVADAGAEPWLAGFAAAVVGNEPEDIEELIERLNSTAREAEVLKAAAGFQSLACRAAIENKNAKPSEIAEAIEELPFEIVVCLFADCGETGRENIRRYMCDTSRTKLEITGADLIALGYNPSRSLGAALAEVLRRKRDGSVGNREEELTLAEKILKESC